MINNPDKIEIFISYVREDVKQLDSVIKALNGPLGDLIQEGKVGLWDDRQIIAGGIQAQEIRKHLQAARIVLLLISADYIASKIVYSDEMQDLMRRHYAGEVRVIPILLRAAYWKNAPFGKLAPLPAPGEFINNLPNRDTVLLNVAEGVRKVVETLLAPAPLQAGTTRSEENKSMANLTFTHGYALLIGVGGNIPVTVKDATALYDLLINPKRAGYPEAQVTLLTEATANRTRILAEFDRLIEQANQDPEATVLVYFSGHGGKFSTPGQPAEYFLVPHGYDPDRQAGTALSDQEFTAKIEAIKARKLIVLLDCCHAGGVPLLKGPDTQFEKSPVPPSLLLETGQGRVVVASSSESEVSYTGTPYSVFTTCLMEALEGKAPGKKDGFARILDVLAYLFDQVPSRTKDKQHPFVNKILNLDNNFSICYYAGGDKGVPGEAEPVPPTFPTPGQLTSWQRKVLNEELSNQKELQALQKERVQLLRRTILITTNVLDKFNYQQQLLQEELVLRQINDKIDEINQKLQQ